MSDPRYVLTSVSGWAIPEGRWGISYSVIDTAYNCEEVERFPPTKGWNDILRKRQARKLCAELNELDCQWQGQKASP